MRMKIKKILITGGAGFIGLKTAKQLAVLGYQVVLLDNFLYQIHGLNGIRNKELAGLDMNVSILAGDVLNPEVWRVALKGVDAILHLAALTGTGQSMYETYNYSNVNIGGTAVLLDLLPQYREQIKKIVIASSRSIYGEGRFHEPRTGKFVYPSKRNIALLRKGIFDFQDEQGNSLMPVPTDEDSPVNPQSTYAISKYAQEKMILNTCPALGIEAVALRYQNVYGPGQSLRNPYTGIVSIFSTAILQGQEINIFEDGLASRDFVFVDDVVEANVRALEVSKPVHDTINVGTGKPVNILEVVGTLAKHLGKKPTYFISGEFRIGDIRHNFADITRMKTILGFEPKISFDEGIKLFLDWVVLNKDAWGGGSGYAASLEEIRSKGLMGKKQ